MASRKMEKNEKRILIISIIVAIVLIIIIILASATNLFKGNVEVPYQPPEEQGDNYVVYDGVKSNNNIQFRQTKKYGIYKISSATLTYEDGESTFTALVKVEGEQKEKIEGKPVKINMLDENRNIIVVLRAYMPDILPNETVALQAIINTDIVDVYDFEVVDDVAENEQ